MKPPQHYVDFPNRHYREACDWIIARGGVRGHGIHIVQNLGQISSWAWFDDGAKATLFKLTWGGK